MKKILLCSEQLDIGGVETSVITQTREFSRRGYHVTVVARDGLLRSNIDNIENTEFIDFDFKLTNNFSFKSINDLKEKVFYQDYDLVYIEQFPLIQYMLPILLEKKIPYFAYLHNLVKGVYTWFVENYPIYRLLFPIFFKNATKIIAITESVKKEIQEFYQIPDENIVIAKNSLVLADYPNEPRVNSNIEHMMIVSRIVSQKKAVIEHAINYYHYCKEKYNPDLTLTIVGDGDYFETLKEDCKDLNIQFMGASKNVSKELQKTDVLLGVDRCVLEGLASKRLTVICGYSGNITLVTPENIELASKENFSGDALETNKDLLFKVSKEQRERIVNQNYQYIMDNFDIKNNIFVEEGIVKVDTDYSFLFEYLEQERKNREEEVKRLKVQVKNIKKSLKAVEKILNK